MDQCLSRGGLAATSVGNLAFFGGGSTTSSTSTTVDIYLNILKYDIFILKQLQRPKYFQLYME